MRIALRVNIAISTLYIVFFCASNINAQNANNTDCNCANTPTPQKYMNKVNAGTNVQICAQCADLALRLCQCECATTTVNRKDIETAIAMIEKTLQGYKEMGSDICCPELLGRKSSCPNAGKNKDGGGSGGAANSQQPQGPSAAAQLNESLVGFANQLGSLTNDPNAQAKLKTTNDIHAGFGATKDIFKAGGLGGKDLEFFDNAETAAHIINMFSSSKTPEQKAAEAAENAEKSRIAIEDREKASNIYRDFNSRILALYNDAKTVKLNNKEDKLIQIEQHEKRIKEYDDMTAAHRLFLLRYMQQNAKIGTAALDAMLQIIDNERTTKGLPYIKSEISRITNEKQFANSYLNYLGNANRAFKQTNDELALQKAEYYFKKGDNVTGVKILEQLANSSDYVSLKKAIQERVNKKDYQSAGALFPVFIAKWTYDLSKATKSDYETYMEDMPIGLSGLIALIKSGQGTNAEAYFEKINTTYQDFFPQYSRKANSDERIKIQIGFNKIYQLHTQAELALKKTDYKTALSSIDSALYLNQDNKIYNNDYYFTLVESRVNILINKKDYEAALIDCKKLQSISAWNKSYNVNDGKYTQAIIYYNMGKHTQALNTLMLLKSIDDKPMKYYVLEREIYVTTNNVEKITAIEQKIFELSKQN